MDIFQKVCDHHNCLSVNYSITYLFFCTCNTHAAIQILFVPERHHWIATHYSGGEVLLYDSCFPGTLSPSTEEQLVRLYQPAVRDNLLMVTAVSTQQQEGSTDCGLFSIAAAYHAAVGDNLEGITFNQAAMREHLMECLERKELSLFPTTCAATTRCPEKHLFVHGTGRDSDGTSRPVPATKTRDERDKT